MSNIINLKSSNIGVFPTVGRPTWDPLGRLTTEYNLTSLLNTLLDEDSFVITKPNSTSLIDNDANETLIEGYGVASIEVGEFQFNIKGYIFKIHNIEDLINEFKDAKGNIWAYITIENTSKSTEENNNLKNFISIAGGDSNDDNNTTNEGAYEGLKFTSSIETIINNGETINESKICHYKNINTNTYALKILEYVSEVNNQSEGWYIPADSRIKFKTNKSGSQHSVTIDDGEL